MGGGLERSHASAPGLVGEASTGFHSGGVAGQTEPRRRGGGGRLVASGFFSHLIFRQLIKDGVTPSPPAPTLTPWGRHASPGWTRLPPLLHPHQLFSAFCVTALISDMFFFF